jgi:hypothetical protein
VTDRMTPDAAETATGAPVSAPQPVSGALDVGSSAEAAASRTADLGVSVTPYRTDDGRDAWAWCCLGTDGCDGRLGLNGCSEEAARRELGRHIAEDH